MPYIVIILALCCLLVMFLLSRRRQQKNTLKDTTSTLNPIVLNSVHYATFKEFQKDWEVKLRQSSQLPITIKYSSEKEYYTNGMNILFSNYLEAIINKDKNNIIYKLFLNNQTEEYLRNTNQKRMVIDFISGMTDDMFINEIKRIELLKNQ